MPGATGPQPPVSWDSTTESTWQVERSRLSVASGWVRHGGRRPGAGIGPSTGSGAGKPRRALRSFSATVTFTGRPLRHGGRPGLGGSGDRMTRDSRPGDGRAPRADSDRRATGPVCQADFIVGRAALPAALRSTVRPSQAAAAWPPGPPRPRHGGPQWGWTGPVTRSQALAPN
jgi:hypothetical protein